MSLDYEPKIPAIEAGQENVSAQKLERTNRDEGESSHGLHAKRSALAEATAESAKRLSGLPPYLLDDNVPWGK